MRTSSADWVPRLATPDDAAVIGRLLHDFNTEFDTPSPGGLVLADRLQSLLASPGTFAIVVGAPAVAMALITLRTNVWFDGRVALLDELYVSAELRGQGIGSGMVGLLLSSCLDLGVDLIEINVDEGDVDARRFYVRHGFASTEPDSDERALYFFLELSR